LEAGSDGAPDRIRWLTEMAIKSRRLRPSSDLSELLRKGSFIEFGREPEPTAADNTGPAAQVYVDGRRLRLTRDRIRSVPGAADEGPARLFISDVPLMGNSSLVTKLRSASSDPISIQIKAFDQQSGAEMGVVSETLPAKEASDQLRIPLHHVYGRAAFLLELSAVGKIDLVVEAIWLD
jgi:hypothetical protein